MKIFGLVVIIMFSQHLSAYVESGTYINLMRESLKASPLLKSRSDTINSSKFSLRSARSRYYPQLDVSNETGIEKIRFFKERQYSGSTISMSLPLFDFNRDSTVELRKAQLEGSKIGLEVSKTDLLFQVNNVLAGYFESLELERVNRRNIRSLKEQRTRSFGKFQGGDLPKTPYMRVQGQVLSSQAQLRRTMQRQNFFAGRFKALTGSSIPKKMRFPQFNSFFQNMSNLDLKELSTNSPTVVQLQNQVKIAEKTIKNNKAQALPRVSLEGSYQYDHSFKEEYFRDRYESSALLTVQIPIYTGGRISSDVKSALYQKHSAAHQLKQEKWNIENEIDIAFRDLTIESEIYFRLKKAVDMAKAVIKAKNEQFAEGSGRYDLVLEAEAELFNYQRSLIQSQYEIFRKKINILWRLGKLNLKFMENHLEKR